MINPLSSHRIFRFWSEQLEGQKEYTTEAAGRRYRVTELQTLLFPTSVGEATIDPAQLTIPGGFLTVAKFYGHSLSR